MFTTENSQTRTTGTTATLSPALHSTGVITRRYADSRFATSRGSGEVGDAIFVAAGRGDLVSVRRLLDADPSLVSAVHPRAGGTPLHFAALAGQTAIMHLLVARGADPLAPDLPSLLARLLRPFR